MKSDGQRCKGFAVSGSDRCYCHAGQLTAAATKTRRSRRKPKAVQLDTAADARRELARVYNGLWRQEISSQTANALTQTLNTFARVLEATTFERRLDELSQRIHELTGTNSGPLLAVVPGHDDQGT